MLRIVPTRNRKLIERLDRQCFPDDDPPDFDEVLWWVVKTDEKVVGYAGLKILDGIDKGTAYLCRCGILPEYQGLGLQKKLVEVREREAIKRRCPILLTYTSTDNYPSLQNLIRMGFNLYDPAYRYAGKDFFYLQKRLY